MVTTTTKTITIHLSVEGMMCQRNCGTTVANALRCCVQGAVEAQADFETRSAWVRITKNSRMGDNYGDYCDDYDDELYRAAVEAVEAVGFEALIALHLQIEGMICQTNCGTIVANALKAVEGVYSATAIFAQARAVVVLNPQSATTTTTTFIGKVLPLLVEAVKNVGFDATPINDILTYLEESSYKKAATTTSTSTGELSESDESTSSSLSLHPGKSDGLNSLEIDHSHHCGNTIVLGVGGMSCAVCTGRVERCLLATPGVVTATVVLSTQRAIVEIDESMLLEGGNTKDHVAEICCAAVRTLGYTCQVVKPTNDLKLDAMQMEQARQEEAATWRRLVLISVSLLLPMMIFMPEVVQLAPSLVPSGNLWLMFVLASLVQYYVGKRFYVAAWKGWNHGRVLGMDFLIVLGTTAGYVYSVILFVLQLFTGEPTTMKPCFMTGAMLLTFVTLGKFLESYACGKTADAVHKLMELQPSSAIRVTSSIGADGSGLEDISALTTQEVPISHIREGDFVRVLPGGQIPADGVLVAVSSKSSGGKQVSEAFIDESAFSGEPFPVSKTVGDSVYGSTINQLSVLVVRVTASGSDTLLSKTVRLVEDAQRHKAPIQAYADRLASVFAPVVVGVAIVTFLAWMLCDRAVTSETRFFSAFMSSISVIVVACPCALGLATPTAVMVGTGVGAIQGILIKGGAVLESMHTVDTVIFDKTGTLTCGKAELSDEISYLHEDNDEPMTHNLPSKVPKDKTALWLAVCAEAQSEHPLAQAIIKAAQNAWDSGDDHGSLTGARDGVCVDAFVVQPGRGVECRVSKPDWGRRIIRVGSREWTKDPLGKDPRKVAGYVDPTGDADADNLRRQGKIAIYLSVLEEVNATSRRVIGVFGIVDPLKPEAQTTVTALQKRGVNVWMCTGDNIITALAVARIIGIPESNVCAEIRPEGKADLVTRLQKAKHPSLPAAGNVADKKNNISVPFGTGKVAMVADGINDSIALARADVGIAIGAGTEIALEAADVVLVRSNLHDVVVAFHLSSVVFRRILLNFVLAIFYNIIAVPFAAGMFYPLTDFHVPPELAGFMMACSSISVVTSSLLLRRYQRPQIKADGSLETANGCLERLADMVGLLSLASWQGYRHVNPPDHNEGVV